MVMKLTKKQQNEVISAYTNGENALQISKRYPVCDATIRNILKKYGIPIKKARETAKRKHYFDQLFFDTINDEKKAYWLGFIVAEGNVYATTLSMQLAAKDRNHLLWFAENIQAKDVVLDYRKSKDAYRLRLNSIAMIESLNKLGVVPRKSHFITVPRMPEELLSHFFRGFLDGDGWISKRVKTNTWYIGFASCCKKFIFDLQSWVNKKIGKKSGSILERKKKKCWQLSYSGNNLVNEVCSLLYFDATVFLNRKFASWQRLANNRVEAIAKNKHNIATRILTEVLAHGPKQVEYIMNLARENHISEAVFRRCRIRLGIKRQKIGGGAGSYSVWGLGLEK